MHCHRSDKFLSTEKWRTHTYLVRVMGDGNIVIVDEARMITYSTQVKLFVIRTQPLTAAVFIRFDQSLPMCVKNYKQNSWVKFIRENYSWN